MWEEVPPLTKRNEGLERNDEVRTMRRREEPKATWRTRVHGLRR